MWCYEHFPTLFKNCQALKTKALEPGLPLAQKYEFHSSPKTGGKGRLIEMRLALDSISTEDVVFDIYKEMRESFSIPNDVAYYHGPLFHPKGYIMADPTRVMRQYGCKQLDRWASYPVDKYLLDLPACISNPNKLHVVYDPVPQTMHWSARENRIVNTGLWEVAEKGNEADELYLGDYEDWSHPLVVRPPTVEVPPQEHPPPAEIPQPRPPTMSKVLQALGMVVSFNN